MKKETSKPRRFTFTGAAYGVVFGIMLSVFYGMLFPPTEPSQALRNEVLFAIFVYPVTGIIGAFAHPKFKRRREET